MLKKITVTIMALCGILAVLYVLYDEPLPHGKGGVEAERLADKMLKAVNYAAWDSTVAVKWSFPGGHNYLWDKKRKLVEVRWGDKRVLLNTKDQTGMAFEKGSKLSVEQTAKQLQTAWEYFSNDSFWLAAPFKIRDPGTKRSIVNTLQGKALLVHYTSGGVTPGDSYLWILDNNGQPTAWKIWAQILPIGGMEFTWEGWQTYTTGVQLASFHNGIIDVKLTGIEAAMDAAHLNGGVDPFDQMTD